SRIVLPALRAMGVAALDLASASHADSDHAGALAEVLGDVPARAVAVPPRFPPALLASLCARGERPMVVAAGDAAPVGAWGALRVDLAPQAPLLTAFAPDGEWRAPGYDPPRGARDPPLPSSTTLLAAALLLGVTALVAVRLRWLTPGGAAAAACLGFGAVVAF